MTRTLLTLASCLILVGCGSSVPPAPVAPAGPSYAEALTIYNQELSLLERLKTSARELEASHEEKISRLKTSLLLGDAVKDLQAANEFATIGNLLTEEQQAQAKAASEKARNQLGDAGAKANSEIDKAVKEYESKLADLNKQIAEQESKVANAKQVKDEAEQRQQK